MATIVTRSGKGSPLTHAEVDSNFTNLNTDKLELSGGTMTGNLSFGDNDKAIFGAGSDLEIYHDGFNSIISDVGTGGLFLSGASYVAILNSDRTEYMLNANQNGSLQLYYDGSEKLETTSTGVDITGTLTSDGLTVDGTGVEVISVNSTQNGAQINFDSASTSVDWSIGVSNSADGDFLIYQSGSGSGDINLYTGGLKRQEINRNGDISFYEDTGTTAKFFWDASEERPGLGTTAPSSNIDIEDAAEVRIDLNSTAGRTYRLRSTTDSKFIIRDSSVSADRLTIDSSGNVTIKANNTSGGGVLNLENTETAVNGQDWGSVNFISNDSSSGASGTRASIVGTSTSFNGDGNLVFSTAPSNGSNTEAMRIDSSGNVGIGTTTLNRKLNIQGDQGIRLFNDAADSYLDIDHGTDGAIIKQSVTTKDILFRGGTASGQLIFETGGAERMRIDSSGNLLVGKTSVDSTIAGVAARGVGDVFITRSGANPLYLNRLANDGDIVKFYKDSSSVGSIGTQGGLLNIGNGDCGLAFSANNDNIYPTNVSTSTNRDAAIDLGGGTVRFKDLYLSGGLRGDTTFKNNAGTTEYARFDSSGNLLVGQTLTSDYTTTVGSSFRASGFSTHTADANAALLLNRLTSDGDIVEFRKDNTTVGSISVTGSATAYNTSSDHRLKENVVDLTGATTRLKQLEPKRFNFIADAGTTVDGFLAHEVQDIVPEAITGTHNEVDADGNPVYQGIDQSKLVPLLVATIKELEARITALENA